MLLGIRNVMMPDDAMEQQINVEVGHCEFFDERVTQVFVRTA